MANQTLELDRAKVFHGDCREHLRSLPDDSIDAVVTDPPYELGFMAGKISWDSTGIAYSVDLWREVLRVLKPGGHLLAFGSSRTTHRIACAIEDAGFEVRDTITWHFATGFPKSLDVSKAIDATHGQKQPVIQEGASGKGAPSVNTLGAGLNVNFKARPKTAPVTEAAKTWVGFGTNLKPATEFITMARKPLTGTVAQNVLEHGTGALNIDGTRIPGDPDDSSRWPSNVLFDEDAASVTLPEHAQRFFYVAKPTRKERDQYCAQLPAVTGGSRNFHPTVKPVELMRYLCRLVTPPGGTVLDPFTGSGTTGIAALREGFRFIGMEASGDYWPITTARISGAHADTVTATAPPAPGETTSTI